MEEKKNFTAGFVADSVCEPGRQQTIRWDKKTPGLGLRVTAKGAKSYIFETRLHGKTLRVTIGDIRTWPLESSGNKGHSARAEATRLKALTDQGLDPREIAADQKEASRARKVAEESAKLAAELTAKRQTVTMGDAWADYIEVRRKTKKEGKPVWCAQYVKDHKYAVAGKNTPAPLAALAKLRLVDLTPERISKWLKEESAKRPTSTSVAFRKLRAFAAWCEDHDTYSSLMPANACTADLVRNEVRKGKPRTDNLQREQLPLWFQEVAKLPPVVSAYLRTLLLTGARREELAGLTWSNTDFRWNSLTIKDKVEGERVIPMTPYVAQMLSQLPRRNKWVFSSPTAKSGRIQGPHVAHGKALTTAGLPHVSIHGLRRSFKSLAEWVEMPVGVVAQIMGHKQSATAEKHYTVRPLDLLRMWHTRYEAWLLEQAGVEFKPEAQGLRVVA